MPRLRRTLLGNRRFRLATARYRILPSFIIIGAQRAGTTSLFNSLRRHPDVARPAGGDPRVRMRKEVHFFDRDPVPSLDWYRSFFPLEVRQRRARSRGRDLLAGESTPFYLAHPDVPRRVAETLPDAKLIALLRNPVDRAYSHYNHARRKGHERLKTFAEAIAAEGTRLGAGSDAFSKNPQYRRHLRRRSYLARGRYAEQLERWLEYFPREQLLVVRSEDLFQRPAEVYAEVLDFLGLRPWQLDRVEHRNRKPYDPLDPEIRRQLEELFAEPNARLEELLGRDFGWGTGGSATVRQAGSQVG